MVSSYHHPTTTTTCCCCCSSYYYYYYFFFFFFFFSFYFFSYSTPTTTRSHQSTTSHPSNRPAFRHQERHIPPSGNRSEAERLYKTGGASAPRAASRSRGFEAQRTRGMEDPVCEERTPLLTVPFRLDERTWNSDLGGCRFSDCVPVSKVNMLGMDMAEQEPNKTCRCQAQCDPTPISDGTSLVHRFPSPQQVFEV